MMIVVFVNSLSIVAAMFVVLWILGTLRRDVSIVDLFWGIGFVIVMWLSVWRYEPTAIRVSLLAVLTTLWGLRLTLFIAWRNHRQGEDRRYAEMRVRHGTNFWWISLFSVFLLQALILWFVSLPLQVAAYADLDRPLGLWDVLGFCLWSCGMFFETVGDWQLARFKADPANFKGVMNRGLWRYTRHPNYFGDFCVWWGLYAIAANGGATWTVGSPLLMSLLLMKVSGVSLLERTIVERRPEYAAYQARTNAFFPGPPQP